MKDWIQVSRQTPCPICHKPDWCLIGKVKVLCNRVPSNHAQPGGGWLHDLDSRPPVPVFRTQARRDPRPIDVPRLILSWAAKTPVDALQGLAKRLGVSEAALAALNAVWAECYSSWAFPMRDGFGNMVGIRLRSSTGRKFAVTGSKQGIFLPVTDRQSVVYICEGPTDTAAALTLGLFAIGRPSCNGGLLEIRAACRQMQIYRAVIVADHDDPGQKGARILGQKLGLRHVIWTPPAKDIRDWLNLGGTRLAVEDDLKDLVWQKPW